MVDTVTLDSVVASVFGARRNRQLYLPRFVSGVAGQVHTNVTTATAEDDEGTPAEDEDKVVVPRTALHA